MEEGAGQRATAVLQALADLSPSAEQRSAGLTVPTEWFRWLPANAARLFYMPSDPAFEPVTIDRRFGERLAAVDQIRPAQRSLRLGWLFVAGRVIDEGGRARRVFHPLVTLPVRVSRMPFGEARLLGAGDAEVSSLVEGDQAHYDLERHIEFGGGALDGIRQVEVPEGLLARLEKLQRFARAAAAAAGLPATQLVPAREGPEALMRLDHLVIVAGVAVYAVHETGGTGRASSLRAWAEERLDVPTAFHWLYVVEAPEEAPPHEDADTVESPYLLTPVQREAVRRSRHDPVTLISGAPGTGKSHTIAAIACDALARGQDVLVAAKSDATVDALLDLFERAPGPDPVVFGSNERREALAARLSAGQLRPESESAVSAARRRLQEATSRRDQLRSAIADQLEGELLLARANEETDGARVAAPGFFDPGTDLVRLGQLLEVASRTGGGWWSRRRRRRATRAAAELGWVSDDVGVEHLAAWFDAARAHRAAADLAGRGGLRLGARWEELRTADDQVREAVGRWLAFEGRSAERLNRSSLAAVAALATALRSGRSARREQLKRLNDDKLTRALPLWVGTLPDIDDLLPQVPGLFDLVILDEASSIDQPLAAPALLRGRRAVIAGDPRQLRHVSFLSDEQIRASLAAHGMDAFPLLAAKLDVRRNSVFDVATGVAPVVTLDEHFRSDPHLVEFVARRLYGGALTIATRSPQTQCRDCVQAVRMSGARDADGVVQAEVDRTLRELEGLLRRGVSSVGVVTPFRAQADALEAAALGAFTADDLEALDLRVGTVHAFQGNERDVVIASLGLGPDDGASSWRFVEDPHLFAVFATRARRQLRFLYSADPPAGGLVAAYLAQANSPPGRPKPAGPVSAWAAAIAHDLDAAGVPVLTGYPTGRHVVDVCVDDERRSVAVECDVHRAGADAHIERHLALRRAGWDLLEAYPSRWAHRRGELIVNLVEQARMDGP